MGRYVYYILFSVLSMCLSLAVRAQTTNLHLVRVDENGKDGKFIVSDKRSLPEVQTFSNLSDANDYVRKTITALREQGYLGASLDSIVLSTEAYAYIYQGAYYQWARLSFDSIPVLLLNNMNIRARDWEHRPLHAGRFSALCERMIKYCENNGYPFAKTTLQKIEHKDDGIYASLQLDRGDLIRIDTIEIESDVEVSRSFLQNYLGIHQGDLYNEGQMRLLSKKLSELSFLQEAKPWQMEFAIDKNKLKLHLKDKKANQLNGLIGIQPNTVQTGKFLLTADVLLGLKNVAGLGESIAATYQNLQYKSPRFHADFSVPYLLGTPFGAEGSFDLYKKDTTYFQTTLLLGIKYQFNATDYFKISYQTHSNHLINADTNYVIANHRLPDNLDLSTSGANVEFNMERTDYRLNPRKGWQATVTGIGLVRNVKTNDAIANINDGSNFNYASLYDTVNSDKYQYKITASLNYYISPFKNIVVKVAYNGGYISSHNLFLNELYMLGGFKLLRGFDEQSIFANQYHIGTIELRFLVSKNSYFYLFNDDAAITSQYSNVNRKDNPVSFGGGITLENKSGIFNVALGLGKFSGAEFSFKQAKIHFGYSAYF